MKTRNVICILAVLSASLIGCQQKPDPRDAKIADLQKQIDELRESQLRIARASEMESQTVSNLIRGSGRIVGMVSNTEDRVFQLELWRASENAIARGK